MMFKVGACVQGLDSQTGCWLRAKVRDVNTDSRLYLLSWTGYNQTNWVPESSCRDLQLLRKCIAINKSNFPKWKHPRQLQRGDKICRMKENGELYEDVHTVFINDKFKCEISTEEGVKLLYEHIAEVVEVGEKRKCREVNVYAERKKQKVEGEKVVPVAEEIVDIVTESQEVSETENTEGKNVEGEEVVVAPAVAEVAETEDTDGTNAQDEEVVVVPVVAKVAETEDTDGTNAQDEEVVVVPVVAKVAETEDTEGRNVVGEEIVVVPVVAKVAETEYTDGTNAQDEEVPVVVVPVVAKVAETEDTDGTSAQDEEVVAASGVAEIVDNVIESQVNEESFDVSSALINIIQDPDDWNTRLEKLENEVADTKVMLALIIEKLDDIAQSNGSKQDTTSQILAPAAVKDVITDTNGNVIIGRQNPPVVVTMSAYKRITGQSPPLSKFVKSLMQLLFTQAEMAVSNFGGVRGKIPLDKRRISAVVEQTYSHFGRVGESTAIKNAINEKCRGCRIAYFRQDSH